MHENSPIYDVAVIGAGPVGLSLALHLVKAGKNVIVLEKKATLSPHSRAPAIWPATQEIFCELGVIDQFLNQGMTVEQLEVWDADRDQELLSLSFQELANDTGFPHLLILPQEKTEHILLKTLQGHGLATVLFGTEVTHVEQTLMEGIVQFRRKDVLQSIRTRFIAGCDGAHSIVRDALQFSLVGRTYPTQATLADVNIPGTHGMPFPRVSTVGTLSVGILMGKDLWRIIQLYEDGGDVTNDIRTRHAVRHLFGQQDYELVWHSVFALHRRISSGFATGRIVLAGDAAHLNSPVGGQGMNAGIQDASLVSRALIKALEQDQPKFLAIYARRRRAMIESGVNRFTDILTRLLLIQQGKHVKKVVRVAKGAAAIGPLRYRLLMRLAMLN